VHIRGKGGLAVAFGLGNSVYRVREDGWEHEGKVSYCRETCK